MTDSNEHPSLDFTSTEGFFNSVSSTLGTDRLKAFFTLINFAKGGIEAMMTRVDAHVPPEIAETVAEGLSQQFNWALAHLGLSDEEQERITTTVIGFQAMGDRLDNKSNN